MENDQSKPMVWPQAFPQFVLDDLGVRHIHEVTYLVKYELEPCECKITHKVEDHTWYHKALRLTKGENGRVGVYRACKECRNFLVRKKVDE